MHTVILGSAGDVRARCFQQALGRHGYAPAEVITYEDFICGRVHLAQVMKPGSWLRIESPGKDKTANHALLRFGAQQPDEEGDYTRIAEGFPSSKGEILAPRQWYLGLKACLVRVREQLEDCPPCALMNWPEDISMMFDKRACHAYLQVQGVSVPPALPPVASFDELEAAMQEGGWQRVFVKLAHGSSASGVVAYQSNGIQHRATAAIEMVMSDGVVKLYNTRRIQTFCDHAEIARLINALCVHRVHVEQWIPKASMEGKTFDLRVVVIAGQACHTVARLSRGPMTNLHLLNERRDRETARAHLGADSFQAGMALCEAAMCAFPRSLYAGIDLLVARDLQKYYVIEMNAFGDLLHDVWWDGLDTYSLEIERMTRQWT